MQQPRVIHERQMTAELDERIRQSLCTCFPAQVEVFSHTRKWHGSAPAFSVIMEHQGRVVAHVGIVDREVKFDHQLVRAAGVQNVFVLPEFRGKHLAETVMNAAADEASQEGYDCGLLFCVPGLAGVYQRTGWLQIPNPVVRVDNDGKEKPLPENNICMFLPLTLTSPPKGLLHLRGNDW